jgi:hypothetical protein
MCNRSRINGVQVKDREDDLGTFLLVCGSQWA